MYYLGADTPLEPLVQELEGANPREARGLFGGRLLWGETGKA